jgi:hypothetical protein
MHVPKRYACTQLGIKRAGALEGDEAMYAVPAAGPNEQTKGFLRQLNPWASLDPGAMPSGSGQDSTGNWFQLGYECSLSRSGNVR